MWRTPPSWLAAALLLVLVIVGDRVPAAAAAMADLRAGVALPTATTPPSPTPVPSVQLDAAGAGYVDEAARRVRQAEDALHHAQRDAALAEAASAAASSAVTRASDTLASFTSRERAAIAAIEVTTHKLRDLAVSTYLSGGPASSLNDLLDASSVSDFARRRALVGVIAETDARALHQYTEARTQASHAAVKALDTLNRAQLAQSAAAAQVLAANALVTVRTSALSDATELLRLVTAAVEFPGTDIPRMVLDAYQRAAAAVQQQGCQLSWTALAAIGKIESDHGRAQHAKLTLNGDVLPPIIGPALDGSDGTALVPDADNGRWDGDSIYAHAIGPMQFIESTWASVGRDGNGDGVADPNNIYDASLAAAAYLCRAVPSQTLSTDRGLRQAFFSYNHSDGYADEVLLFSHIYAGQDLSG
jgi:membrane-bound lytic murein transglycosylase B